MDIANTMEELELIYKEKERICTGVGGLGSFWAADGGVEGAAAAASSLPCTAAPPLMLTLAAVVNVQSFLITY